MLIKNNITFSEEARVTDPEENFLLLRVVIQGTTVILGSIYGPNEYNPNFFNLLDTAIRDLGNWPIILGGDWNCTFSSDPILLNIDCRNMVNLPNFRQPISLLNCIYKIISKSINNRLKKIVNTVTSRAQKGFTLSRYI